MAPNGTRRGCSHPLRASVKLAIIGIGSLAILAAYLACRLTARPGRRLQVSAAWTQRWARFLVWAMGCRIAVHGELPRQAVLLAPNHLGYVDIAVLGALLPTFFVAKAEVASWPLFGLLASAGDHIFVARRRTRELQDTAAAMARRLAAGCHVCVFLEGTSGSGETVLPFRSSFLQPAIDCGCPALPVASRWRCPDGIDPANEVAYWGDHHFFPHLWHLLGLQGLTVEVKFGQPIRCAGLDRKAACAQLHQATSQLLASL